MNFRTESDLLSVLFLLLKDLDKEKNENYN